MYVRATRRKDHTYTHILNCTRIICVRARVKYEKSISFEYVKNRTYTDSARYTNRLYKYCPLGTVCK